MGSCFDYAGSLSMMYTRVAVGITRVSRKPAAANRSRNLASERWRPPVLTSMLTSLAAALRHSQELVIGRNIQERMGKRLGRAREKSRRDSAPGGGRLEICVAQVF